MKTRYGERIDPASISFERLLPGPLERVWAFLTDGEKRKLWLAGGRTDLVPGGVVEFRFENRSLTTADDHPPAKYKDMNGPIAFDGRVLAVEPMRRLEFTWPERDGGDSEVTFELEPAGDMVRLRITHRRITHRDDLLGASAGWHAHLDILEARLGGPKADPFWASHTRLEEEYAARFGI